MMLYLSSAPLICSSLAICNYAFVSHKLITWFMVTSPEYNQIMFISFRVHVLSPVFGQKKSVLVGPIPWKYK